MDIIKDHTRPMRQCVDTWSFFDIDSKLIYKGLPIINRTIAAHGIYAINNNTGKQVLLVRSVYKPIA